MVRVIKGQISGEGRMRVYGYDSETAVEGATDAFLDQDGNNCTLVSSTGTILFFAVDTEALANHYRALADMIERNIAR